VTVALRLSTIGMGVLVLVGVAVGGMAVTVSVGGAGVGEAVSDGIIVDGVKVSDGCAVGVATGREHPVNKISKNME